MPPLIPILPATRRRHARLRDLAAGIADGIFYAMLAMLAGACFVVGQHLVAHLLAR